MYYKVQCLKKKEAFIKMRGILKYSVLLLLIWLTLLQAHGYKVIGSIKDSDKLFDKNLSNKKPAVFEKKGGGRDSFIIFLNKPEYIDTVNLWMKKKYEVEVEVSQNLFTWTKVNEETIYDNSGSIYRGHVNLHKQVASFVKIILPEAQSKFYLYELQIVKATNLSVKQVKLTVLDIKEHSVRLQLDSDIAAIASIQYGLSVTALKDGPLLSDFSKHHTFDVKGLLKGTDYYFVSVVKDCNGGMKYSQTVSARTKGIPLPLIKTISVKNLSYNTSEIRFNSNVPTDYTVRAGLSSRLNFIKKSSTFSTQHIFILKNYPPMQTIFYSIEIKDAFGNMKKSAIRNFESLPYNIGTEAEITGDFNYVGESLGPVYQAQSIKKLVDGDISYNGSVMSGTIEKEQKIFVDFKKIRSLKYIDLIWWGLIYSTDFVIYSSMDKHNWEKLPAPTKVSLQYPYKIKTTYLVNRVTCEKKIHYLKFVFKKNAVFKRFPQYNNLRLLEILFISAEKKEKKVEIYIKK